MARAAAAALTVVLLSAGHASAQETLKVGQPVDRAITAGATHEYTIALDAGDYVAGVVDQRGIMVLAAALTPDGARLRNFGGPREGKRTVAFIAERAGTYRLELRAPSVAEAAQQGGSQTEKGTYEVNLLERLSFDERMKAQPQRDRYTSPAIEALRKQIAAGDTRTESFWQQAAQSATPLVEPIEGEAKRTRVTFLWRATVPTRNVMVLGSFMTGPPTDYAMTRLADTDVWYLTVRLPSAARFAYSLSPNDPQTFDPPRAAQRGATVQGDPLNPRRWGCSNPTQTRHDCQSMAELPGAPPQPWIVKSDAIPAGKVDKHKIASSLLKNERNISVYTPPDYRANGKPYALLVLFDEGAYLNQVPAPVILDNLIAAGKIPPMVAVLIANPSQDTRGKELPPNPQFAEFLATELLPWIHSHYTVTSDPKLTTVGGSSYGGIAATYAGLRHSEIFGNVLCQSGSFWWAPDHGAGPDSDATTETGWLAKEFIKSPKLPLRFWMDAGVFEVDSRGSGGGILEPSRHMRDVLLAKGYDVHYQQFSSGHDYLNWRGTLADGLIALVGTDTARPPTGGPPPNPNAAATAADHKNMMEQLGIKALRPGPSGNESAPNHANYDESLANPYPNLPDALTLENGHKVTSAEMWWKQRRPEIVEDFDREVLGRVPRNVPKVAWRVSRTERFEVGGRPVVGRDLIGTADNSAFPEITVEIQMTVVTPANAAKPVPVMMMFSGRSGMPPEPGTPATAELIADGWGYAVINPGSIQADNGAGLTKGIIGLVNKGQRRRPEEWGALRAWAWGASRGLDYLVTDKAVDAKNVGIEGVSRFGKAALITMAYDQRFAVVLIGSSGEGGAKLHRRNFGEAVENLTGAGEYHWMAGNFLKYGAEDSTFGRKTAADLPVDAHELLALCAPRLTFISYGIPERGDARWLDQQGSYMAAVAAQPVFRLLGAKGLGVSDDYVKEKMPAVNVGLLDGQLAWRQHDGGHTDGPNWKYFIPWADKFLAHVDTLGDGPADRAAARTDQNSMTAHEQLLAKAKQGRIDVYFEGDSIVRRWGALDYPELLANWRANFLGWNAANFGWGADRTQNILWRLEHGELDGINPKVIVVLAGTNNVGTQPGDERTVAEIARGIKAIVDACQQKAPNATIVLTAIFPRNDNLAVMPTIDRINEKLAGFADGTRVRFLTINDRLADAKGKLVDGVLNERDKLHPTIAGYQIWADALKPILRELLGPPGTTDLAPPPTGDPSAARRLQ